MNLIMDDINDKAAASELDFEFEDRKTDYAAVFLQSGDVYCSYKEYDLAIEEYIKALKYNPNYVAAYYHRDNAYTAKGDIERAALDYDKSLLLDPGNEEIYNVEGNLVFLRDDGIVGIGGFSKDFVRVDYRDFAETRPCLIRIVTDIIHLAVWHKIIQQRIRHIGDFLPCRLSPYINICVFRVEKVIAEFPVVSLTTWLFQHPANAIFAGGVFLSVKNSHRWAFPFP
jgi:tetratricopeptide (TPR) repeat protein